MRRFFSAPDSFESGLVSLNDDETKHLRDVLRLKSGEQILVFDGEGAEFLCRIDSIGKRETAAAVIKKVEPSAPESPLDLTLAPVAIPGEKYDLIVQKAVELGVNTFIPLASVRSEIKLKDLPKKLSRWRRIAIDAAKQCGRARLMTIVEPLDLTEFLGARHYGCKILFSEREGSKMPTIKQPEALLAVVGPKGGWDDTEIETARSNGYTIVTLGGRIMRAETAAIALTAILQNRFGDIN